MSQVPRQDSSIQALASGEREDHVHLPRFHAHHPHGDAAKLSLLRLSVPQRLAGVLLLLAGLWALVFWALH
jgi:hypothetical protein